MRLYTSKVIADWLGLTERRVRQLRDEGIIEEQAPGLYDLRATTRRYISYLRSGSLADERAGLTLSLIHISQPTRQSHIS